jgi:hypothetical protein
MSLQQKQKCVSELHGAAAAAGLERILEVSTRSTEPLGASLSAMNLTLSVPDLGRIPVECVFQGGKVFERGGPFTDLLAVPARAAKRDDRLRTSGRLVAFRFCEEEWPLQPATAFYDWLYLTALHQHPDLAAQLHKYRAFTDIEFNPRRSLNTQARSCALYLVLLASKPLDEALSSKRQFLGAASRSYNESAQWDREPALL